jgi:ABC-2 type transport system ATP-binding protein
LDPSSRADLWAEVARLAREDGVTVFLTTQYLEEADVLADRVGIIDHGHIVAEGTPEALKAEIGRPSVEATPADRSQRDDIARVLAQFGAAVPAPPGVAAVRLDSGHDLTAVVRALDASNLAVVDLQLHQPSLDDVFLTKTGRKLDEAGE